MENACIFWGVIKIHSLRKMTKIEGGHFWPFIHQALFGNHLQNCLHVYVSNASFFTISRNWSLDFSPCEISFPLTMPLQSTNIKENPCTWDPWWQHLLRFEVMLFDSWCYPKLSNWWVFRFVKPSVPMFSQYNWSPL
jgi:hypothetical protein